MRSRLYAGHVRHRRTPPRAYQFTYGVYYAGIDLDEIGEVDRCIRLFSYNRPNVLSLLDRDHLGRDGTGLRDAVRAHRRVRGVPLDGARVMLLTNTRVFGYVFNPVSFFVVRDAAGAIASVLAEVHNTHGERHVYDLARDPGARAGDAYVSATEKAFYVSPFIEMDARYVFRVIEDAAGRFDIGIDEYRGDDLFFQAQLRVVPLPLTNANVARMLVRYPLITLRTIALIHWHGLKLWLRGVKYLPHTPREAKP